MKTAPQSAQPLNCCLVVPLCAAFRGYGIR